MSDRTTRASEAIADGAAAGGPRAPAAAARRTLLPGSPYFGDLTSDSGARWEDVRQRLAPRFRVVYGNLAVRIAAIATGLALQCLVAAKAGHLAGLATAPLAALWMGYWMQAFSLFLHEAAHFNLHPRRAANDALANALFCPFFGWEASHYRRHHWQHHLQLGTPDDTEVTYHHAPTWRFALETATGLHVLRVARAAGRRRAQPRGGPRAPLGVLCAIVFHLSVVALCGLAGWYSAALAWAAAIGIVFPTLSALRQIIEHRRLDAYPAADYTRIAHGPVNRMFGVGRFARTFGSAGFNRHLLHHWCPTVSYTRFDGLEDFLRQTHLAAEIDAARTTYHTTLRQLARGAAVRGR